MSIWRRVLTAAIFLFSSGVIASSAFASPQRIIIDTDPGTDDAMAILLALTSPELIVEALTVVPGNVDGAQGLENALKLVTLAGRTDIPVAAGAHKPLIQTLVTAESHGTTGLGNVDLPSPEKQKDSRFGPDLIIELVHKYPGEITIVPMGPLTNLALAVSKDPSIAKLTREVVLMGGSITGGNVDAVAEFNIYVDPEAAQIVFQAGWPLTMVGLEIGRMSQFKEEHLARLRQTHGTLNDFASDLLAYRIESSRKWGYEGTPIYDATALAAVIDRTLIATEFMHVNVELCGQYTRAQTVGNRQNGLNRKVPKGDHLTFQGVEPLAPNIHVATSIDEERFLDLLITRLSGK